MRFTLPALCIYAWHSQLEWFLVTSLLCDVIMLISLLWIRESVLLSLDYFFGLISQFGVLTLLHHLQMGFLCVYINWYRDQCLMCGTLYCLAIIIFHMIHMLI